MANASGTTTTPPDPPSALTVHLAEYHALSAEILDRFTSQRLSFTVTVTLLGGAIAGLTGKDFALNPQARAAILLAVPILVASAAAIFFDSELVIYRCADRILGSLRDSLVTVTGDAGILKGTFPSNAVDRFVQMAFSFARWLLFLAGPVTATAALILRPDLFPRSGIIEAIVFNAGIALEVLLAIGMGISLWLQFKWSDRN